VHTLEHGKPTARMDKVLAVLRVLGLALELRRGDGSISVHSELGE
jgi:hypothetical protein